MLITLFGASGHVGQLVTQRLLREGHHVRAFVHRSNPSADHPALTLAHGDIHDTDSVSHALSGSQAVISTLGSWGTDSKDILTIAMQHIIPAMQHTGIKRIITLTGADARAPGDDLSLLHRASHTMISLIGSKVLSDSEQHIQLLATSSLDWTVLRSPIMTNSKLTSYTLADKRPLPWSTIPRTAVASAIVDQLADDGHMQKSPFVVRP